MELPPGGRSGLRTRSRPQAIKIGRYREHEENILHQIMESRTPLCLQCGNISASDEPSHDEERNLLEGTIHHYERNGKWFSQIEVQVAFRAWELATEHEKLLSIALSNFLIAVLSPHSDSHRHSSKKRKEKSFGSAEEKVAASLRDVIERQGYVNWCALAKANPSCMVLLKSPIQACLINPEDTKKPLVTDELSDWEGDIPYKSIGNDDTEEREGKLESAKYESAPVQSTKAVFSDSEKREMMKTLSMEARYRVTDMFYGNGIYVGRVLPSHYHIALATDDQGYRYLSDARLNETIPLWEKFLVGEKIFSPRMRKFQDGWNEWCMREEKKVRKLHNSWPGPGPLDPETTEKEGKGSKDAEDGIPLPPAGSIGQPGAVTSPPAPPKPTRMFVILEDIEVTQEKMVEVFGKMLVLLKDLVRSNH